MFHVFVLATPSNSYFATPPLHDVTFGKWPFGKMSGGLRKKSWDLEEFRTPLYRCWDVEEFHAQAPPRLWEFKKFGASP